MPSFYPSTRSRTLIAKHLAEHHDDDDDAPNSIYKDALIIQIFQHWKIKTLEHQQAINNGKNLAMTHHFSQALPAPKSIPSTQPANVERNPPETPSVKVKDDVFVDMEPEESIPNARKRVMSVAVSHLRQKENWKRRSSSPNECVNPHLLAPGARHRSRTAAPSTKQSNKPPPIFIAPKKTQPSAPPRLSTLSSDESIQTKRKFSTDKINTLSDDQTVPTIFSTWAPAPPTISPRFYVQSPRHSLDDDDETSSDDGSRESLLIRNKNPIKSPIRTREKYQLAPNIIIPTAVIIIDPNGRPYLYDLDSQSLQQLVDPSPMTDENLSSTDTAYESGSSITSDNNHALHSIGEEEEDILERNSRNGIILSKELHRIEAFTRSRQTKSNVKTIDHTPASDTFDPTRLGRRWSDGIVSDDDQNSQVPLVKGTSTISVMKASSNHPPKISKTKYFLMKLHLTSSSKEEESNGSTANLPPAPPPRKRTVRRSSDKTRYQTR